MGLFNDLIYITLGKKETFSRELNDNDWERLYNEAKKQSLIGALLPGVEKAKPAGKLPKPLMRWWGKVSRLEEKNKLVSKRSAELTKIFADGGFHSCVLKGQSVALYYPNPLSRQCGDIDLWVWKDDVSSSKVQVSSSKVQVSGSKLQVSGSKLHVSRRDEVLEFVRRTAKSVGSTFIHHIDAEYFDDVDVEVHVWPSYSYSPFRYRKYKKFFSEYKNECLEGYSDCRFNSPSLRFNAVYLLLHIFRHVYHEGIGLRQLMDYYYCLEKLSAEERRWAFDKLKWMGLERFTAAIMFVEQKAFALDEEKMLCLPDEKYGRFLLKEIVRVGNFGHYDRTLMSLQKVAGASLISNWRRILRLYMHNVGRLFKMVGLCPSEALWSPIWKPTHFCWRKIKGY